MAEEIDNLFDNANDETPSNNEEMNSDLVQKQDLEQISDELFTNSENHLDEKIESNDILLNDF